MGFERHPYSAYCVVNLFRWLRPLVSFGLAASATKFIPRLRLQKPWSSLQAFSTARNSNFRCADTFIEGLIAYSDG